MPETMRAIRKPGRAIVLIGALLVGSVAGGVVAPRVSARLAGFAPSGYFKISKQPEG